MRYDLKHLGWSWSSRVCGVWLLREETPNMPCEGWEVCEVIVRWREIVFNHTSWSWVRRGASERSLQVIPVLSHSSAVRSNQDHNRFIQLIYARRSWRGVIFCRVLRWTKTLWDQNLFVCSHVSYFVMTELVWTEVCSIYIQHKTYRFVVKAASVSVGLTRLTLWSFCRL